MTSTISSAMSSSLVQDILRYGASGIKNNLLAEVAQDLRWKDERIGYLMAVMRAESADLKALDAQIRFAECQRGFMVRDYVEESRLSMALQQRKQLLGELIALTEFLMKLCSAHVKVINSAQ